MLGLLGVGAVGLTATTPAVAAGTSNSIFNCYTQWWNTAWAQKCSSPGAKYAGTYTSGVACSSQADKSMSIGRAQYSTATYSGTDCTFGASNGWITYS
ncbi:hypothetical protein EFE23_26545 [Micromonospora solifontis]|uniref:Uncharacterized protein n=1 Tax=Micromonospora solifontis TaxID=2487138 RepID=A0ABX9W9E9_9ACTN|nr:hypothetical protein EFE23_26545 [Micromonospora solifontis]